MAAFRLTSFSLATFLRMLRSTVGEREREGLTVSSPAARSARRAGNYEAPPELTTTMPGLDQPLLINILGHAAGALIFAIFLVLLYNGRGWSGMQGRYLSALAACLSLAWNLGSLVVLAWPALPAPVLDLVVAISFSVLSLLPAVLLQVSLEGAWPALVGAGYVLSTAGKR